MRIPERATWLVLGTPIVFTASAIGLLFGAISGMALSWDGSYYLFNTLESRQPFEPHARFVNAVTQAPTLLSQNFTDQLPILRLVYGISYMAIPLVALLASWVVLRRGHRHMFVWSVLALLVATLPGQVNATCEALQSAQLTWPILLAAIVGIERGDRLTWVVVVITGLFAAVAHPFGVALMAGVLLVCLFGRRRREATLVTVLLAIAAANALSSFDPYETDRITATVIGTGLDRAIFGGPLIAIAASAIGAALIAFGNRTKHGTLLAATGVACQVLAIAALEHWARDPSQWGGAIEFRSFTPIVIVPVALVAFLDGRQSKPADTRWRQLAALTAALGFALIMVLQGLSIQRIDRTMTDAMNQSASGCAAQGSIPRVDLTVLDSWATTSRSLLYGTRAPTRVVLPDSQCAALLAHGALPLADWDHRTVEAPGWFDLTGLGQKP
jgi:hypothetical protein